MQDMLLCKELVGRLPLCGDLAADYVKALTADEAAMDRAYHALQVTINAKDLELMTQVMDKTVALVQEHSKRARMAKGHVVELEKKEKEREKGNNPGGRVRATGK